MKKKIIIVTIIIVLSFCLIPIPNHLRDGGTVIYKALFYKITKVHKLVSSEEAQEKNMMME